MNIEFLATVAVIAPDPMNSRSLYVEALGLPLEGEGDGYYHSERIAGCKSFGIWPLYQAAQACFATDRWPAERPVPQVSIEFDVPSADAVDPAARELVEAGHDLLHEARGTMGSDGRPAAVTRRRNSRHRLHAGAPRLNGGAILRTNKPTCRRADAFTSNQVCVPLPRSSSEARSLRPWYSGLRATLVRPRQPPIHTLGSEALLTNGALYETMAPDSPKSETTQSWR